MDLNATTFLEAGKPPAPTKVNLPGDAAVYVRRMGTEERDAFEALVTGTSRSSFRTWLVVKCAADATGKRLFSDGQYAVVAALDSVLTEPVWRAAAKLNRLLKTDVDELVGNSPSATSGASGSSSPATSDAASPNASSA